MIDRYSRPEMSKVWSDERKFQIWLDIEVLACEAMAELGQIRSRMPWRFGNGRDFQFPKFLRSNKRTNHDVIAFLENVAGSVGPQRVDSRANLVRHFGYDAGGAVK